MSYTDYDRIGKGYDRTRTADPYLTERLLALMGLPMGANVLDIGCGTGNYTLALQDHGLRMTAVDPSELMLNEARGKSSEITWIQGAAEALPVADGSFDGAVATLTTHHWTDLAQGYAQAYRALRPGAPFVLLCATPEQTRRYWLAHYFPTILARSCAVLPGIPTLLNALSEAGFPPPIMEPYSVRPDLQDHFLYSGKDDPSCYLDAGFRNGISTFKALSDDAELEQGLKRLEQDIASGAWFRIRQEAEHEDGDYRFLKVMRPI